MPTTLYVYLHMVDNFILHSHKFNHLFKKNNIIILEIRQSTITSKFL